MRNHALALLMLIAAGGPSNAADISAAPFIEPSQVDPPAAPKFERAAGSAGTTIERDRAVSGSTILTPVLYGSGNNYSYFRFLNAGGSSATFSATLVGAPTGTNYGTVTITVAPHASPQYSITDFFNTLRIAGPSASDRYLSLYVGGQQTSTTLGVQHVVYNAQNGFFEDASVCQYQRGVDYTMLNQTLVNVHTSLISAYPSTVYFHSYYSVPTTYRADVYKAGTGSYIGSINLSLGANDTSAVNVSDLERTLGYTPGPAEYHVNIFYSQTSAPSYNGVAVQAINNQQLNSLTNMSVACAVNP